MKLFSTKANFILGIILFPVLGLNQNVLNHDSLINEIINGENLKEKCNLYYGNINYTALTEKELKDFNSLLLKKINSTDKEYFKLTTALIEALFYTNRHEYDLAETKFNLLIKESKEADIELYMEGINGLAILYTFQDKFEKAIRFTDSILDLYKTEMPTQSLGLTHQYRGAAYRAMDFLNLSTKEFLIADSLLPNNNDKVINYLDLAVNYGNLDDLENAEKYLLKANTLNSILKDEYMHHHTQIEFGILYQKQQRFLKSDSVLREAKKYFEKIDNQWAVFDVESELLTNNTLKKEHKKAVVGFTKHLRSDLLQGDSLSLSLVHRDIAENHLYLKNGSLGLTHVDSALLYFNRENSLSEYLTILEIKRKILKQKGNYYQAISIYEEIDSLKKIKEKQSNFSRVNELKYFFETEKKEKENLLLKTEKAEISQAKQKQFYQLLIGILILALGLVVVYLLFKNRQKKNEKLKELDTLKSKFFESISHELRTPLTLIQLPVAKALEEDSSVPKKDLKTIKYNAKRLQNLMDDLLSITRIEANKYPLLLTENNISEQTSVLAAQFDSLAESNDIEYVKNIKTDRVIGKYDKEVFNKVLINLISNAIKYSLNGGKVTVDFEVENSTGILQVSDQGMGIKKEDQQYIFDKFYRVNQNNENIPGSGIGLSIVKELLELIGGSISFESEEGKGTKFKVKFPIQEMKKGVTAENTNYISTHKIENQPATELDENELAIVNADKPHVLVVEDNQELLAYIKEQLSTDYKVFTAKDGQIGIDKGLELVPDLIISDWLMPKKNGIELCEAIKQNEITSHVPVIMLTAKTEVDDKIKGFETGADSYIAKPFEMNILKAQIKNIILQREKLREKFNQNKEKVSTNDFSERDLKFWKKVEKTVQENLSNPEFSVQSLADQLFVSRMQLNRKMKALVNLSGKDYLIREKITLAKRLLKNKDLQISEVAFKVGYDNLTSFSRVFKKETGFSPSDYRKNSD